MKRSERIKRNAWHELGMSLLFSMATLAAGAWAVAALQSGTLPGGTALIVAAAIASGLAWLHGREASRMMRMSRIERNWEYRREVRPRL